MSAFNFNSGSLFCEQVSLSDISDQFDTPAYIYSKQTLERNANAYVKSFTKPDSLACFAVKSLSNISILKLLNDMGCGFDIVSGGELYRVLSIGADPKKIIFSGVGKSKKEIEEGILEGILSFNVESVSELYRIEKIAGNLNKVAPVSIRFNPDIDSGGHDYITTGRKGDKFGISSIDQIIELSKYIKSSNYLNIVGLASHIGSQILELDSYRKSAKKTIELADSLIELGITLEFLDLGGRKERLILEPGRSISANAGVLITKVEYIKDDFLVVDAAMNDLIRPALYKAEHDICNIKENTGVPKLWNVVGPICESSDFLAKNVSIDADEDDILAIKTAGAYGFVMSSNYNTRPRACEVLVDGDKSILIRKRESLDNLLEMEIIGDD
jgi:diaminopimelate decarboxylase